MVVDVSLNFKLSEKATLFMIKNMASVLGIQLRPENFKNRNSYGHPVLRMTVDMLTQKALTELAGKKFVDIGSKYHKISQMYK